VYSIFTQRERERERGERGGSGREGGRERERGKLIYILFKM